MTALVLIFIVGTIFLIWFSWWASLKDKRFHGIYRFFSFDSILALVLLNARFWFVDPFRPLQVISWVCLVASLPPGIQGFYMLKKFGRSKGKFEETTNLVAQGAYRYIRHPMYASLILLGLGAFLKNISLGTILLAFVNIFALYLTAKADEIEMLSRFGGEYAAYMKKTRTFIPFIF
jgi:protein-S-isoprenylcysteine O-methyltransferase Ste14